MLPQVQAIQRVTTPFLVLLLAATVAASQDKGVAYDEEMSGWLADEIKRTLKKK